MKKRVLIGLLVGIAVCMTACGKGEKSMQQPEGADVQQESESANATADADENNEMNSEENQSGEENPAGEISELTFEDLSKKQFEFSSGAGGWGENFRIERDGYFTGNFHDSDMGDIGEGYDGGTIYVCSYTGHFTDLKKISDYAYEMKLQDITYHDEQGMEKIVDDTRYIYTTSYCLGDSDTFRVYLPNTPLKEFSEEVLSWLTMANGGESEVLTMYAIVDEKNGYGIYSYDRLPVAEDAVMTFDNYKMSYDYYEQKMATEDMTTVELSMCSKEQSEISDECLNYLWNLVRYQVDEDRFEDILEQQRSWIKERDQEAEAASAEFEGGTFAPIAYWNAMATKTIERCEELVEILKNEN